MVRTEGQLLDSPVPAPDGARLIHPNTLSNQAGWYTVGEDKHQ